MAKEVSPELLEQLKTYLQTRERSEKSLLSFFYKEVFGKVLNVKCGGCIEDAVSFLNRIINNKKKVIVMGNFKWVGGDKIATLRHAGQVVTVSAKNCTDSLAVVLYQIPKYSHLVEFVGGETKKKSEGNIEKESEVTTSTLQEPVKEKKIVKAKKKKAKLK